MLSSLLQVSMGETCTTSTPTPAAAEQLYHDRAVLFHHVLLQAVVEFRTGAIATVCVVPKQSMPKHLVLDMPTCGPTEDKCFK